MARIHQLFRACVLLFCAVLLFVSLAVQVSATETPPAIYDTRYDEEAGELSVYMHIVNAERGNLDLLPVMKDAAKSGACVDIDAGPVKLYFSSEAVKLFSEYEGELILLIRNLSEEEEEADDTTAESGDASAETEEDPYPPELRYRISIGDNSTKFDRGDVRIRFRYHAETATDVRAFAVSESGTRKEVKSVYTKGVVSFYPDRLGEFAVNEYPVAEGIPKVVYLTVGGAIAAVLASIVLAVLLKTGTLKRLYLKIRS